MAYLFYPACDVADLAPGQKLKVEIEGYPVCVYNVDGTFFASGDFCPHEHVSLGEGGTLRGDRIVCGAHRWQFNVKTGECYEDPAFELPTYPCGRRDGVVYVGFWSDDEE